MTIVNKALVTTSLTSEEMVYLRFLLNKENEDYEMAYKLKIMFGLEEEDAFEKVNAFLAMMRGETL